MTREQAWERWIIKTPLDIASVVIASFELVNYKISNNLFLFINLNTFLWCYLSLNFKKCFFWWICVDGCEIMPSFTSVFLKSGSYVVEYFCQSKLFSILIRKNTNKRFVIFWQHADLQEYKNKTNTKIT